MTMLRRTAQGRLSEMFGPRTAKIDELMRRLDLYGAGGAVGRGAGRRDRQPRSRPMPAASTPGSASSTQRALGRGAPEFFLFSNQIAAWQPADSIAIVKLMALQLSATLEDEVLRARASLILPPARVADILPDDPLKRDRGPARLCQPVSRRCQRSFAGAGHRTTTRCRRSSRRDFGGASNAWAAAPDALGRGRHAAGQRSASGLHRAVDLVSRAAGAAIGRRDRRHHPGRAAWCCSGRSEKLGWGLTTAYLDDQDVHIEKLNPDNPTAIPDPGRLASPSCTRQSIIQIKGADAGDAHPALDRERPGPAGLALRPGARSRRRAHVASLSLDRADRRRHHDDRRRSHLMQRRSRSPRRSTAGELFVAPAQNLMLADQNGIAMQIIGTMPRRDAAQPDPRGGCPAPAGCRRTAGSGTLPYSANPELRRPARRHPRQHQQQDRRPPVPAQRHLRLGRHPAHPALAAS